METTMTQSLLAIEGGKPIRPKPWPSLKRADAQTHQNLIAVLESDNWSNGTWVQTFEKDFATFLGAKHAVMTVNATMALKLALLAYDIGPGDEVVIPALNYPSVAMSVLECGATPVFCDVDPETCCMSAATIEPVLSSRTRVLLPTHVFCSLCDMPPILEIARKRSLIVIEDCAHAAGARRHEHCAGTWGDAAIFSFNQKKQLTCGEGGCLVSKDANINQKVFWMRDFDSKPVKAPHRIQRMGKVSEFQTAVLCGQLASYGDHLRTIEERAELLRERLERLPRVRVLRRLDGTDLQTFYNFCFRVSGVTSHKAFRDALSAEIGLPVGTTYKPLDIDPALDCSQDRQFQSLRLRAGSGSCATAKKAHEEAMRFFGRFLSVDPAAVNDIATAVEKVIPHFVN
jgi:dTDP-4-amino-4,6-dideoxygalactose transaminase